MNLHTKKSDVRALAVSALVVALSVILSQIVLFRMPQGGDITLFSMLPIVLCTYMYGTKRGILTGVCVGIVCLIFNPYVIHPVQLVMDYPLAYGALALGGFVMKGKYAMLKGYIVGVGCRYICAVISGIVFFGAYAPEGFNTILWSIVYNGAYLGVEAALTCVILCLPSVRKLFARLKAEQ